MESGKLSCTVNVMEFDKWFAEMSELLNQLKFLDLGYPFGENGFQPNASKEEMRQAKFIFGEIDSLVVFLQRSNGLNHWSSRRSRLSPRPMEALYLGS